MLRKSTKTIYLWLLMNNTTAYSMFRNIRNPFSKIVSNLNCEMKKHVLVAALMLGSAGMMPVLAQDMTYKQPPQEILDIALAKQPPTVLLSGDGKWMLQLDNVPFLSVEELAKPEYKLGGTRVTDIFGPSRREGYSGLTLMDVTTKKEYAISGLPENLNILEAEWAPGSSAIALIVRETDGLYLWMVDAATKTARQVSQRKMNRTASQPGPGRTAGLRINANWLNDSVLIVPAVPLTVGAMPAPPKAPSGPVVQISEGKAAPARTYQDLLKNPYDEQLFDYLFTSQLVKIEPRKETEIGKPGIFMQSALSPDKNYLLTTTLDKPYSYVVPRYSFPKTTQILNLNSGAVQVIDKQPVAIDIMGYDTANPNPRNFGWRADKPAVVYWIQALDEGNPRKNKVEYMDAVYQLEAPFGGEKALVVQTPWRCRGIDWCDDEFALVSENSRATRRMKTSSFKPLAPENGLTTIFDVSTDDNYAYPGSPYKVKNQLGQKVVYTDKAHNELLLIAPGGSPEGDMPYLSRYDIAKKKNTILWRCEAPYYETIVDILDPVRLQLITARQSVDEPVNYFKRDLKKNKTTALTAFPNPYPQLDGMQVEKIKYKRADGIDLTATLYTPVGYDKEKDGRLPVLMWAYPREYQSASDAAQVRGSKYLFTTIDYRSPVFWVTRGFAVMANVEMPIVGLEGAEPNDDFLNQLVMNAEAATQAIHDLGVGDTSRMAVGGHSYGGFMTANLLSHTNLYKAGIARSGAYNRTLTPFGFQTETRTYWEIPEIYNTMSPFMYADKLQGALLLVHGDADNNTGTFPIQSERLFAAVKGHGKTSRLVLLPYESHSYSAQENILQLLFESDAWLDKYVKNPSGGSN